MRKYTLDEINAVVAEKFRNKDMKSLFIFLSNQINVEKDINIKNKLLLLKAECYQRTGDLSSAQMVLGRINENFIGKEDKINVEVLKLKICFQKGNWKNALKTAELLINQHNALMGNVIWRTSMLYAIFNDGVESKKYSNVHREIIENRGFQEANNIIYTRTIPLLLKDGKGTSLLRTIKPIEEAEEIYLKSNVNFDTKKRVGSRLKSICQAFLIESFIEWDYGNNYDAYVLSIMAGLGMAYSEITMEAEGIGEIIKLFKKKYKELISLLHIALKCSEELFYARIQQYSDSEIIKYAYGDAIYKIEGIVKNSKHETLDACIRENIINNTMEDRLLPGEQIKKFM